MEDKILQDEINKANERAEERKEKRRVDEQNSKIKDQEMKMEIDKKYQAKIDALNSGRAKSNSYLDDEFLGNYTLKDYTDSFQPASFSKLAQMKQELIKAREKAEIREKKYEIASKLMGVEIENEFELKRVEKKMDKEENLEYMKRLATTETAPKTDKQKLEEKFEEEMKTEIKPEKTETETEEEFKEYNEEENTDNLYEA